MRVETRDAPQAEQYVLASVICSRQAGTGVLACRNGGRLIDEHCPRTRRGVVTIVGADHPESAAGEVIDDGGFVVAPTVDALAGALDRALATRSRRTWSGASTLEGTRRLRYGAADFEESPDVDELDAAVDE
jgi:hypothetical protein